MGGGGAVVIGEQLAERIGAVVQAEELTILEWLEGNGDFIARATRNGIEITQADGRSGRSVFIHMSNFAGHIVDQLHLDFQWENAAGKV